MRKLVKLATVPAGLLVSGLMVMTASHAAFTATTNTDSSTWHTGSVALTNDHSGKVVFNADGIAPGRTGTKDVTVAYHGSGAHIRMTAAPTGDAGLVAALQLHITDSEGHDVYQGSLQNLAAHSTYATGMGDIKTSADSTVTYHIEWSLPESADNPAIMDKSAAAVFSWTAQSGK
ncbi:hypothetical protein ACMATS_37520 [Streptoverticillium reticulum]|uniref:hypothetical protein n=1 Tax=Streptoverticillium reticulum TaxID=1433415 RepID=UPI0039BEE5A8